uniref:Adenosine 3'-phospho 5'-phosphosulfate transporter 1 n=1 Tax=Strigamia maritima TaxID=126957 RepID=T1JJM8_STRMM
MLRSTVILWSLVSIFVAFVFWISSVLPSLVSESDRSLIVRLCLNLLGYATILVPGYLLLQYVKRRNGLSDQSGRYSSLIRSCFVGGGGGGGNECDKSRNNSENEIAERSTIQRARILSLCALGLGASYLVWGFLQEKIMTTDYVTNDGATTRYSDSQFLVFVNRILALALSGCGVLLTAQHVRHNHTMPLYKYSYCSLSNVMSSWCQYEALKYVSFPIQVLTKACKVIPVMAMGKIVSKKTYEYYEYGTALFISVGMTMFLFGSTEERQHATETTFAGLVILFGYIVFDSFTSNWQHALFARYEMSWVQMMCGVNLFSCLFTSVSLLQQGGFVSSFRFMHDCPRFVVDIFVLSICSAVGQMFVFYTISQFGAVVFAYIMTFRQCLAVLLSCLVYKHPVDTFGVFGITFVFIAVFLRTFCNQRASKAKKSLVLDAAVVSRV